MHALPWATRIRRASRVVALGAMLVAAGWAAPRDAAAAALPVEVDLTIQFAFGLYPGTQISTSGSGTAIVNGSGGGGPLTSLALPASLIATTAPAIPVTDPLVYPVNGLKFTVANAAGTVAATGGGGFGGVLPIPGVARLCLFGPCGDAANVANLSVPLAPVGAGGTVAATNGAVQLTVQGAPWTRGTAMIGDFGYFQTITGFAHGPASGTSSTAQPGGTLQLVTPIAVTTNLGVDNLIFAFGILTVRFVPEPAAGLLLGVSFALILAIRRLR